MPEKHLYEYAVIRILPKVEREEFINVGVILFCKRKNYLKAKYHINEAKLKTFSSDIDIETLQNYLHIFDKICRGQADGGSLATMETPERFRWLTAVRSTSVQTSRPHPGFTSDLEEALSRMFVELVL